MSTMVAAPQPNRKQSSFLRHKIRESFRTSALRDMLHYSEKDADAGAGAGQKQRASMDTKRPSIEETSWDARKKRKNRIMLAKGDLDPLHTLGDLKIDVGGFEDLKLSLDIGSEMYSFKSPETTGRPTTVTSPVTVSTTGTKEGVLTFGYTEKPLMQKLNQHSPVKVQKMALPQAPELEDTSEPIETSLEPIETPPEPMRIDLMPPPPPKPQAEVRKGSKWQVKTDALVRPVSTGKANASSANVSSTIAAINTNKFGTTSQFSANTANVASARQSMESTQSKMTSHTIYTDKVDSVIGSNSSVSTTYTRRPLGDTARTNTSRQATLETDKQTNSSVEQENKRQSSPPVAVRRQSFVSMKAAHTARPKSPTGSIAPTATGFPGARRGSGTNVASRLSWMQELENKSKASSQDPAISKLQGSVADKLRRFESQGGPAAGPASRSPSATRSVSASRQGSELYGIEAGGKRWSRTAAHDEEFRKKLEEQFSRKQKEDEEKERKKNKHTSLPASTRKTSQPSSEAKVAALESRVPTAVFQGASAALMSTTNLLEAITNTGLNNAAKSTISLQRTTSVQHEARKVSPSYANSVRSVSYATPAPAPTPMSMNDEYDPFNYAVYPSRSSIYSNPPEEPMYTESTEHEFAATVVEKSPIEAVSVADRTVLAKASEEVVATRNETFEDLRRQVEIISTVAPVSTETECSPARLGKTSKAFFTPPRTNTWGSRFTAVPAAQSTTIAWPPYLHDGASKPVPDTESATSTPRHSFCLSDDGDEIKHVELVAREAIPASPTLVHIPSSKKSTPVKETFLADSRPGTPSPLVENFNPAAMPRLI